MKQFTQRWLHREKEFSAFVTGPLLHFWRRRQEKSFTGTDGLRIRYVSFTSSQHTKAVLIAPGRIESYVKYPEVAYDLFQCGYDVFIIDHRGQGLSDRMLEDTHLGHVEHFSDYVDDLYRFWQITLSGDRYQQKFALAHSMGGAILTLLLRREPGLVDAAALLAPMFGIVLPMPEWMAERILNWTETRSGLREGFALGTGRWHAPPFAVNTLTHSRVRYQRNLRFYADDPALQVGGRQPTGYGRVLTQGMRFCVMLLRCPPPCLSCRLKTIRLLKIRPRTSFVNYDNRRESPVKEENHRLSRVHATKYYSKKTKCGRRHLI